MIGVVIVGNDNLFFHRMILSIVLGILTVRSSDFSGTTITVMLMVVVMMMCGLMCVYDIFGCYYCGYGDQRRRRKSSITATKKSLSTQ